MKRTLLIVAVLILLTLPMMAGADDQGWVPPEWTPTPPAGQTVDLVREVELLRAKGVLTDAEYTQLTRTSPPPFARQGSGEVRTLNKVGHNPVLSTGGD